LLALLDDLLPRRARRTLIAGPHALDVIELAAARSAELTVLARSVSDAADLRAAIPATHVTVVAGALDGFGTVVAGALDGLDTVVGGAASNAGLFDVVLAADGLDRLLGADSPPLDWPSRAAGLLRLAAPDALVVVAVENEFAVTGLLDRRPPGARHGHAEWRPLHDDPARPTSPAQVTAALGAGRIHALFDGQALLDVDAVARTRPGRPGFRLAAAGLAVSAEEIPLLAPVADAADAAARAGLLGAVAPGWLAVRGPGGDVHTGYAACGGGVLTADLDGDGWTLTVRAAAGRRPPGVTFDPALVPSRLPDTDSVETLLFRLAAAEDVPAFRAFAARVGAWAAAGTAGQQGAGYQGAAQQGAAQQGAAQQGAAQQGAAQQGAAQQGAGGDQGGGGHQSGALICLDDLYPVGDGFTRGVCGWRSPAGDGTAELLAAAWHRFRDRLVAGHRRHPWPPWMADGDDLAATWLAMSGVEAGTAVVKRGREIADLLTEPPTPEPAVRDVLAAAEADRLRAAELAGRILGLERTLRFRDQSLRTREQQLRSTRDELRRLRRSPAVRLQSAGRKVAGLRDPRRLAHAVKRRLRGLSSTLIRK
jgi:hypothetical protein